MLGLPPFPKRCNYINHINHSPSNGPPRIKTQGRWNCAQERIQTSKCSNWSTWWPAYGSNSKNTKCNWFISSLSFYLQEIDEHHQQKIILLSIPLFVGEKNLDEKKTYLFETTRSHSHSYSLCFQVTSGAGFWRRCFLSARNVAVAEISILRHLEIGNAPLQIPQMSYQKQNGLCIYIYRLYVICWDIHYFRVVHISRWTSNTSTVANPPEMTVVGYSTIEDFLVVLHTTLYEIRVGSSFLGQPKQTGLQFHYLTFLCFNTRSPKLVHPKAVGWSVNPL